MSSSDPRPPPPADLAGLVAYLKSQGLPTAADALAQELAGLAIGAASSSGMGRPPLARTPSADRLSEGGGGGAGGGGPPSRSGSALDLSPAASGSLGSLARVSGGGMGGPPLPRPPLASSPARPGGAFPPPPAPPPPPRPASPTLLAGLGPAPSGDSTAAGGGDSQASPDVRGGGSGEATSTATTPGRPTPPPSQQRSPPASPAVGADGGVVDEYSDEDDPGYVREELASTDDEWAGLRRTPSAGGGALGSARGGGGSRGSSLALAAADAAEADIALELYHAARASAGDLTAAATAPPPFRRQGSAPRLHGAAHHPPASPPGPGSGATSGCGTPARLVVLADPVLPSSASSAGLAVGSPPSGPSRGASTSPAKAAAGSPARPTGAGAGAPHARPPGASPFAALAAARPDDGPVDAPPPAATPPPPPAPPPTAGGPGFSFPVTPPSEPVVAPSGQVFGSWPSFRRNQSTTSAWSSAYGSDEEGGAGPPPPPGLIPPGAGGAHPPPPPPPPPGALAGGHPLLWYGRRRGSTDASAGSAAGRWSLDAGRFAGPPRPPSPGAAAAAGDVADAARAALGAGPGPAVRRASGDLGTGPPMPFFAGVERSGGSFPGAPTPRNSAASAAGRPGGGGRPGAATAVAPAAVAAAAARAALQLPSPRGSPGPPMLTALPLPPGAAGAGSGGSGGSAPPHHHLLGSPGGPGGAPPAPLARPPPAFDPAAYAAAFDEWPLRIVSRRGRTGAEASSGRELAYAIGDVVAGRYVVTDYLGAAAFSTALQALDTATRSLVCLKVVKPVKDYVDQSLDEVRLLRMANAADPGDSAGVLRLHDAFYHREHLFLVTEALRADLHAVARAGGRAAAASRPPYFTLARVQAVARQVLGALAFLHGLGILHCDVKPENILLKSYSRCEVKLIDLGSSCLATDPPAGYIQSRAYRAPEVVLGCGYGPGIDVWSLGCVVAELVSGRVLLPSTSAAGLLARLEGLRGPVPPGMRARGRYAHRYYTPSGSIVERDRRSGAMVRLRPKKTTLAARVPGADAECLAFLDALLAVDPAARPTAAAALAHPWLSKDYGEGAEIFTA